MRSDDHDRRCWGIVPEMLGMRSDDWGCVALVLIITARDAGRVAPPSHDCHHRCWRCWGCRAMIVIIMILAAGDAGDAQ